MFGQEKICLDVAKNILYINRWRGRQQIAPDDIVQVREYSFVYPHIVLVTKDERRFRISLYHSQYKEISAYIAQNIAPGFTQTMEHSENLSDLRLAKLVLAAVGIALAIIVIMTIIEYSL